MNARSAFAFALIGLPGILGAADWQIHPGYRSAQLPVPESGKPGFTLLPPTVTGIYFTNFLSEQRHLTNQVLLNGSGVAAGDVDGDGLVDLYFCRLDGPNALYRNLGGWKFEDITDRAGAACANLDATGAALVDIDGDGDLDLIVNSVGGGTHVFLNDGKAHFTELPTVLNPGKGGTSLALGDVDGDGFLDLYVANYRTSGLMDMPNARATFKKIGDRIVVDRVNGRPATDPDLTNRFIVSARLGIQERGQSDALYRNLGGTNFVEVSFTDGSFQDEDGKPLSEPPYDWGLSVMFRDLNGDGAPDIYVCNDFYSEDRIWINDGRGKFRAIPKLALRQTSMFSMGIDFADINRDGLDDFLVVDMSSRDHRQRMAQIIDPPSLIVPIGDILSRPQSPRNTLFLNRGDGTYAEIAQLAGLEASEWSWTPIFLDVDLDGWEDVLISNGQERAARDADAIQQLKLMRAERKMSDAEIFQARRIFPRLATANLAFRNQRDLTFKDVSREWGFDLEGVSHGMCLCDLDGDGDLDVVVNNLNGAAALYRNESNAPRVAVRLKGVAPNTRGIGAKIWLYGGAAPCQSQEMICGGRYLSSDDPMRVFAAGTLTNSMRIEVEWRSGKRSIVGEVKANRIYEIDEAAAEDAGAKHHLPRSRETPKPEPQPLFEDVSQLIAHTHHEDAYDDFERQPSLPRKLSQLGPGVAWGDFDGDGWDDLVIGSGKGGRLAVFRNDQHGGFQPWSGGALDAPVTRDQTSVLVWRKAPAAAVLLAGSANYEDGLNVGSSVREYNLTARTVEDTLPAQSSSTGPLALADVSGGGHLSLFVGGRVVAGRWPEAASSRLFREVNGKWELDSENTSRLSEVGLVCGAVFSDLDGDGFPELILACEWGSIRIFKNKQGKLVAWDAPISLDNQPTTLDRLTGWWNGVTTGDLDNDGKMDIVASNWGRNTSYESHRKRPLLLYYAAFDGSGTVQTLPAHYDAGMQKIVPEDGFDLVVKEMPFVRERFPTHKAYAEASVEEILGGRMKQVNERQASTLETMVFLNRGDHFEARSLPIEAQLAPAWAVCVADFDGDGNEDLFLSQNFFAVHPESPRCDAGRGLWLRGDGQGHFTAVPGQASGVQIYGEQRGAAVCDYDQDGRMDLVVTQNGAPTRLYRNVRGEPGLRVRLKGPVGNPDGIGTQLRLLFERGAGPTCEIHAGSGYWSGDSAIPTMFAPAPPAQLWVRWPGGVVATFDLPKGAREIAVEPDGVKALK